MNIVNLYHDIPATMSRDHLVPLFSWFFSPTRTNIFSAARVRTDSSARGDTIYGLIVLDDSSARGQIIHGLIVRCGHTCCLQARQLTLLSSERIRCSQNHFLEILFLNLLNLYISKQFWTYQGHNEVPTYCGGLCPVPSIDPR